ncbi:MAG: peptidoglycan DD-metalloendopeptidase family protein [Rhodobacteraceae bacterium]|nr:peptidoglycan DD-metalloendopeptidase family protein [Paracoccaceae bacterium]
MTGRLTHRLNAALERVLPEQRIFLRSDYETRFVRVRPVTQALMLAISALVIGWTLVATSILFVQSMASGDARQQAMLEQSNYEQRLNGLADARDARAAEAASAQTRFNTALDQVSLMQSALLASEDHRTELETGIDVIQKTLRRVIKERDAARAEADSLRLTMAKQSGADHTDAGHMKDMSATVDILASQLGDTAAARDSAEAQAAVADAAASKAELDTKLIEQRNALIFSKLEAAVKVSMAPLDKVFRSVGLDPQKVLAEIRSGYTGEGGPLTPIPPPLHDQQGALDATRANGILDGLSTVNFYRLAEQKVPLGLPLKTKFVYTSGFGGRLDPFTGARSFHPGQDMGGAYGSPVYATADGIVVTAGWVNGYGREVMIQHAFGIQSLYGHLSQIRVQTGQRVSRGDRIGDMGSTGRSTGTHLHYEIRVGGKAVNPMTYIKAATNVF